MSEDRVRFTDQNGNPISHEAFETVGFTEGMQLEGQLVVSIKCKTGILAMAARCNTLEDFTKLGPLMYQQFMKENK